MILFNYIQEITSVLTILMAMVMLIHNYKSNKHIVYLFIFLVLIAITQFRYNLLLFGGSKTIFAIIGIQTSSTTLLTGPAIYFFIRSMLNPKRKLNWKDSIHLIPFFITLIFLLPYFFTDFSYKLDMADQIMNRPISIFELDLKLIYPHQINLAVRLISNLAYVIASIILLYRYKRFLGKKISLNLSKNDQILIWLWIVLFTILIMSILLGILVLSLTFSELVNKRDSYIGTISNIVGLVYLSIPINILLFPHVLTGFELKNLESRSQNTDLGSLENIRDLIILYMNEKKPYLNPEFDRHTMSQDLNVPIHQLQNCMNTILQKTFVNLKNEYRISHAKELLCEDHSRSVTLEAIANQSGFASYSNFYSTFKEVTGLTPKQWINQNSEK